MKIRATSHIAIGVSNMERSLKFYRDLLGLKVTLDDSKETQAACWQECKATTAAHTPRCICAGRWSDATFIVFLRSPRSSD